MRSAFEAAEGRITGNGAAGRAALQARVHLPVPLKAFAKCSRFAQRKTASAAKTTLKAPAFLKPQACISTTGIYRLKAMAFIQFQKEDQCCFPYICSKQPDTFPLLLQK